MQSLMPRLELAFQAIIACNKLYRPCKWPQCLAHYLLAMWLCSLPAALQLRTFVQQIQKQGCQLVKACSQAVDSLAGTGWLDAELELERCSGDTLRELLAAGSDLRGAALESALHSWSLRLRTTLPQLAHTVRSGRAASLQAQGFPRDAAVTSGNNRKDNVFCWFTLVLRRELAASALGCANPLCTGAAATVASSAKLPLCAGCRGVRYCR